MIREEELLAALDKPHAIYSLKQLLDPSSRSTDGIQVLLMRMRMRDEGKVKFDINTGRWRRPGGTPGEPARKKSGTERNQKRKNSPKNHSVH